MKLIIKKVEVSSSIQKWPKHYHKIPQRVVRKCDIHLGLAATLEELIPCDVYADLTLFLLLNRYAILGSMSPRGIRYEINPTGQ